MVIMSTHDVTRCTAVICTLARILCVQLYLGTHGDHVEAPPAYSATAPSPVTPLMTRMLAAVTYPDLVPHNRAFGVGRGLFSHSPLSRGTVLVCPDVPRTAPNPQLPEL